MPMAVFTKNASPSGRRTNFDDAIERAELNAAAYAENLQCRYLGLAQVYAMVDEPVAGAEVFSLMRDSDLAPSDYLDTFFDTSSERQQR
jgi:hypothetical protein